MQLGQHQVGGLDVVGGAELEVGAGVARVQRHRALEEEHRAVQRLVALQPEVQHAAGEGLVGVDHVRLLGAPRHPAEIQAQTLGELGHDAVLQREDLGDAPVGLDRVRDRARLDVGDAGRDPDDVAQALERAAQDPPRAELAADAGRERLVGGGGGAGELAQRFPDALAGHDRQPLDALQVRGQRLRDTGAQPVGAAVASDVGEGHHGHRVRRRRGHDGGAARPPLDRVQVAAQLAHRLVPFGAVLGQHLLEHALQLGDEALAGPRQRGRVAVQDRVDHLDRVGTGERKLPREQLVEHDAQREDVGARVQLAAERLLGRHVGDGADEGAVAVGSSRPRALALPHRRRVLREAEHLHAAAVRHHHVRGLDVAVDDPPVVGLGQRLRDLPHEGNDLVGGERAPARELGQRPARHVLHGDEARPALGTVDVVDLVDDGDVGMGQRRGDAGLAQQARAGRVVTAGGQQLERDLAAQSKVLRQVDLAHASGPEPLHDPVAGRDLLEHARSLSAQ